MTKTINHIHLDTIPSTNQYLLNSSFTSPTLVTANQQTAGRGQRGRSWYSPANANLYLSLGWLFQREDLSGLSLACAVAVRRALLSLGVNDLQFKWPNDLFIQQKKLGGILVETTQGEAIRAVMGIGINVQLPPNPAINQPFIDLAEVMAEPPTITELGQAVAEALSDMADQFEREGFCSFFEEWNHHDHYKNQLITVTTPSGLVTGVNQGVDSTGALILHGSTVKHQVTSGSIQQSYR